MTDDVSGSYDSVAELYAELFLDQLDKDHNARRWLDVFAERATGRGAVFDVGCGPGYVVAYLAVLGLDAIGVDFSPGQIAQARQAFPDLEFRLGDLSSIDVADSSAGGIVSRHSIIHIPPEHLDPIFREWLRVLEPGAPLLLSFSGTLTAEDHCDSFDHKVATAYAFFPDTTAQHLSDAGFSNIEIDVQPPPAEGRPFTQATVLARRPDASAVIER